MASFTLPARSGSATDSADPATTAERTQAEPRTKNPEPKKARTRSEYRPDIDGIRGAAAIMVMGFHAHVPGFEGAYIGLDLFFVVSGYVITGLLMYEYQRTGGIKWGAFYARRARRLIPAKATMLIGVLVLSYLVATPTGSQQQTAKSAAAAAGFVSNFFFWQQDDVDYFGLEPGTGVLLHTWSLSVEEQFYLALPLAIFLAWLLARVLRMPTVGALLLTSLALAGASLWLAIAWASSNPDAAYYLPITRAFEFLLGVALALVVRKVRLAEDLREVMGLAGAAIIAFVLWKPMPVDGYPSYWALLPCIAAALLVWAGVGGPTAITRFLSARFLVGLGLVSYGWYLWHWPLLVLGESLNLAPPPLWARVGLVLLGLFIAYLSYRFIEGLFYKRSGSVAKSKTWGSRRVIISGVVAMSTVASLSTGALALANDQASTPRWEVVSQQLNDVPELPSECLGENSFIPDKANRCDLVPFDPQRPTVVLWGDSHAWQMIPGLRRAGADADVNLMAIVMGGCPPMYNDLKPGEAAPKCYQSNDMALDYVRDRIDAGKGLRVLLAASWQRYRTAIKTNDQTYTGQMARASRKATPRLVRKLAAMGVGVDVVGQVATVPDRKADCRAGNSPYACDLARNKALADSVGTRRWLTKVIKPLGSDADLINVNGYFCEGKVCRGKVGKTYTWWDDLHISATMSRKLKGFLEPTMTKAEGSRPPEPGATPGCSLPLPILC